MGEYVILDPGAAQVELSEDEGWTATALEYPPPQVEMMAVGSVATEGELSAGSKVGNRTVGGTFEYFGGGPDEDARHADMRAKLSLLEQKVAKLASEGGVWRRVLKDGSFIDFYIRRFNETSIPVDHKFAFGEVAEVALEALCAPYGQGESYDIEVELAHDGPVLVTEPFDVKGSAPALASLGISAENDQWWLRPAIESRNLSTALTAGCYYPATDLTPLGTATVTSGVIRQGSLTPAPQAMMSTNLVGVGPMSHVGVFEVYAVLTMPATNTGEVTVYLEWATGNLLRPTSNAPLRFAANHVREGQDVLVSLGEVRLPRAPSGDPRWEGRMVAGSTVAGDDLDVKWIGLVPLAERNATISEVARLDAPSSVLIRDEFDQSAGNLHGKAVAASRQNAGPRAAGTLVNATDSGTEAWVAGVDPWGGSSWGSPNLAPDKVTNYLKATNFGFSIPSGMTIRGIVAEVKWGTGLEQAARETSVRPVKGGTIQGSINRANVGGRLPALGTFWCPFGAENDLWGTAWTHTDINASGFGVALQTHGGGGASSLAFIEAVRVTVFYETAAGDAWVTSGDATDLAVETAGHTAQRSEVSDADAASGRYALAGNNASNFSDVVVGVACRRASQIIGSGEHTFSGVLARYTDANNWLMAGYAMNLTASSPTDLVQVFKRVGGTVTDLSGGGVAVPRLAGAFRRIWLHVDAAGRFFVWVNSGYSAKLVLAGSDSALGAAGALASGKTGFYDAKTGANASTRNYDDFVVWQPPAAGLLFAGLGLEWAHDRVLHQGPDGLWGPVPDHRTDFLKLPPSGVENRQSRIVVLPSRNDPAVAGYPDPGSLSVKRLTITPRYLTVPDPAT
jgi:hypothetical protein